MARPKTAANGSFLQSSHQRNHAEAATARKDARMACEAKEGL
jgi:hypothetical protein